MTDTHNLAALVAAVEEVAFLMDVLPPEEEITAYAAFSGDMNAAARMAEALLPGWAWCVRNEGAAVFHYIDRDEPKYRGKWCQASEYAAADNPARALLLAVLRAKMASSGEKETQELRSRSPKRSASKRRTRQC